MPFRQDYFDFGPIPSNFGDDLEQDLIGTASDGIQLSQLNMACSGVNGAGMTAMIVGRGSGDP